MTDTRFAAIGGSSGVVLSASVDQGPAARMLPPGRSCGVLLPLFSLRSQTDFGVGDFGALPAFFDWMASAKQRVLLLLPLLPTSPSDDSPYACRSAFGLNPLFLDLQQISEFSEIGGLRALSSEEQSLLQRAREARSVQYPWVWQLKTAALNRSFERFESRHLRRRTPRAQAFFQFVQQAGAWLHSYALYSALSEKFERRAFWEWPKALRDRDPRALDQARAELQRPIAYASWLQWHCHLQWHAVREKARARGIFLGGDEPFIVGRDSADAWVNPTLLRLDARLGVPPDDFSDTGQDWGLPWFDCEAMAQDDFAWFRLRGTYAAELYDFRRLDHVVGYFRQWIRDERDPHGHFVPAREEEQQALGERLLRILSQDAGVVAEDLGVIPHFAKQTLAKLQLPGYRVMRWERFDGHYREPKEYPELSLVTTGTHDTDTLAEWWEHESEWMRTSAANTFPELHLLRPVPGQFNSALHEALLRAALNAPSRFCVLPWQDVFAGRERINFPGTVSPDNWSYRISQKAEALLLDADTRARTEWLAQAVTASGRG